MTLLEIQRALKNLGFYSGELDSDWGKQSIAGAKAYQAFAGLKVTGLPDPATIESLSRVKAAAGDRMAPNAKVDASVVPALWMPQARMKGIVFHWTAGTNKASAGDRKHYHILINDDGELVRGVPTIDLNDAGGIRPGYAAHTFNNNTGWIGVSLCCMGGAVEQPFKTGSWPMTKAQWDKLSAVCADLCRRYGITPGPKTVLSHAEVQGTLGVQQKGKWDISVLSFDPSIKGAKTIGDRLRSEVAARL